MKIHLPLAPLQCSQKEIFIFLEQVENFKSLMPDNVQKFEVLSQDSFIFILPHMPEVGLILKEKNDAKKLHFESINEKISFSLDILIYAREEHQSEIELRFNGKFNAMLEMMIKKPLKNFLDNICDKLQQIY